MQSRSKVNEPVAEQRKIKGYSCDNSIKNTLVTSAILLWVRSWRKRTWSFLLLLKTVNSLKGLILSDLHKAVLHFFFFFLTVISTISFSKMIWKKIDLLEFSGRRWSKQPFKASDSTGRKCIISVPTTTTNFKKKKKLDDLLYFFSLYFII